MCTYVYLVSIDRSHFARSLTEWVHLLLNFVFVSNFSIFTSRRRYFTNTQSIDGKISLVPMEKNVMIATAPLARP
jgi:hypothetical protein